MFTVWYSTESLAKYVVENTKLANIDSDNLRFKKLYESDANNPANFHQLPTHIKKILYLDAPDLIVELDSEPIFSLEVTSEAGTGHNAFQRFARIAAALENGVPAFYIYPEACMVYRQSDPSGRWDVINPLIFNSLEKAMRIYDIPALLFYFPSYFRSNNKEFSRSSKGLIYDSKYTSCPDSNSEEMKKLFACIDESIDTFVRDRSFAKLLKSSCVQEVRDFMLNEYFVKSNGKEIGSPITATNIVKTELLIKYLRKYSENNYIFGDLIPSRKETLIYSMDAKFRGDPYPGAIAALDYLKCRNGKTFEDRNYNLVMAWGKLEITDAELILHGNRDRSVNNFVDTVRATYLKKGKILLGNKYSQLQGKDISRYFMQVRFGSTFTKVKHIRVYSYFCDAILFPDGALWRDG